MGSLIDLSGRVVLVVGASKGIGAATARIYARAGACVVLCARTEETLRATTESIGGEASYVVAHAGREEAAEQTVAEVLRRHGRLDVLVNNAATMLYYGTTVDADRARFDKVLQVNVLGPLSWIQQAWLQWFADHGGSVVNIASIGGLKVGGQKGPYDTSKAALIHLTKQLAVELGPSVRVNAVSPGVTRTDFAKPVWSEHGDDSWPWPLRRLGEPEDIAAAALFLGSDLAAWITGTNLVVDGGNLLLTGLAAAGDE